MTMHLKFMNLNLKSTLLILLAATAVSLAGCSETTPDIDAEIPEEEEPQKPEEPEGPEITPHYFSIEEALQSLSFPADQSEKFIPIDTDLPAEEWKITDPDSWVSVTVVEPDPESGEGGGLNLTIETNNEVEVRSTSFKAGATVDGVYTEFEITVRQLGEAPAILVNNSNLTAQGGSFNLSVLSNMPVKLGPALSPDNSECGWIEVAENGQPVTRSLVEYEFKCYAFPNVKAASRSASITVSSADPAYDISKTLTVTQAAGQGIPEPDTTPDIKITISSAQASSTNPGSGVEHLFDNIKEYDSDSYLYHTLWEQNGGTTFPVTVTFTFASPSRVSYMIWYSRFSYANGNPGAFDAEYRLSNESTFRPFKSGTFGSASNSMFNMDQTPGAHTIQFPKSVENVKQVRLTFYSGYGGYIAGVETEFYNSVRNAGSQASLDKVFTDSSYSELRPNVTREDIYALYETEPYFAENVAMPLFSGTYKGYERDFRIGTYEAYSNGEDKWLEFRTRKYTRMDNPTGICVNKGDKLVVCVGPMPAGNYCYLGIAGEASNGYTARYDDFDYNVGLVEGINEITAGADGMCYIVNRAGTLTSSSGAVKVHFIPGYGRTVGYFDLRRHTDSDYKALLGASKEKYFVAKGTNIIFNMHSATLRKYAPDGITSGLTAWDNILGWQLELMGLARQNSNGTWDRLVDQTHFNNHMVAVSTSQQEAYMDASNYRINFQIESAIPKIISLELLNKAEDNTWGPAHEAGHVNQMFMLWKSNAESSNNLFSNYAIYKMGVYGSRGSRLSVLSDYFAKGKSWVEMGGADYEDTEMHMRMNWQLWLYFHRCGGNTQFWPRLYNLLCTEFRLPNEQAGYYNMTEDNGKCQMLFAEAACKAAQLDLTDFFEAWGFLRPVDMTYSQYGTTRYTVTTAMINDLKKKMAAYPKAPAIQFIEDRTNTCDLGYYTIFQNKTPITGTPTYTLDYFGPTPAIFVSGCSNAVGVEVRDASTNALRYFSNWNNFPLQDVSTSNMKVFVVQWDGTRIEATQK